MKCICVLNLYILSIIVCTWNAFNYNVVYVCKPQWNTSVHVYLFNSYMYCIVHIHVGQEYCIVMEGVLQLALCMHMYIMLLSLGVLWCMMVMAVIPSEQVWEQLRNVYHHKNNSHCHEKPK